MDYEIADHLTSFLLPLINLINQAAEQHLLLSGQQLQQVASKHSSEHILFAASLSCFLLLLLPDLSSISYSKHIRLLFYFYKTVIDSKAFAGRFVGRQ